MIVDTSVIVSIALGEPGHLNLLTTMHDAPARRLSAGSWIELAAVSVRGRLFPVTWLDRLCEHYRLDIVPVTVEQAFVGNLAYRQFGLGSQSKAKLNFGDCFSYALAKVMNEPLLFTGEDFGHTDIVRALPEV